MSKFINVMRIYNYVYESTNLINGMYYRGKRRSKIHPSQESYRGSGKHISSAIKKYGRENFSFKVLGYRNSEEETYALERLYVTPVQVLDKKCYNHKPGGLGASSGKFNNFYGKKNNGNHTSESRKKLSELGKLKVGDKNPFFNKSHTIESRKKMSEAAKLRTGDKNPFYKVNHTLESRNKMSKSSSEKFQDDPTYGERIALSRSKGIYLTPYGAFISSIEASTKCSMSKGYLTSICKTINDRIVGCNRYTKELYRSETLTWKDQGFGFLSQKTLTYEEVKNYINKFNEELTNPHLIK